MKIVVLNSGRKNGNTNNVLRNIMKQIPISDIEWDIYYLEDYCIKYCTGCELCLRNDICKIDDDTNMLMSKLRRADAIVLASPVYMGNIDGKLKTFIDRTCKWYHRPELIAKPVMCIVTTGGSALKSTLNYLEEVSIYWGCQPTDKIGKKAGEYDNLNQKEYNDFIYHMENNKNEYKPSLKQLIHYQVQHVLADKLLQKDKHYWIDKGWNDKIYFYDCKINVLNKFFSILFYKYLYSKVKIK